MIQFPCPCGHVFSLADDEAGGYVQCPACFRLNDVPLHSDLQNLAADGTFKLDEPPAPVRGDPDRLEELAYVFRKSRVDEEGEEIDLRNTPEDLASVDQSLTALDPGQSRRHAPQYDPETGELVRPLDLKPDPARDFDPRSVPMATPVGPSGTPVIDYARAQADIVTHVPLSRVPAELFRPVNLVVMSFILIGHVFLNLVLLVVLSGIVFIFVGALVLIALLVAHYGNVIDDIGREENDELPRPLRQMNWLDDLWSPFTQVAGAFILCFLPALLALVSGGLLGGGAAALVAAFPALLLALGGAAVFPAVLLTMTTSGSLLNLRPDRIVGVIRACRRTYPMTVVLFVACVLAYACGVIGTLYGLLVGFGIAYPAGPLGNVFVAFPLLAVGIYLGHLLCWRIGLTYRAHHAEFPWVLQRFHKPQREVVPLTDADRAVMRQQRQKRADARQQLTRHAGS